MVAAKNPLSLPAGALRHSISVEQRTVNSDSFGQPLETWNSILVTRASIEMATQKEVYQAGLLAEQVTHIITIRWPGSLTLLTTGNRVRFGSHLYTVQAVENIQERNRVVRLFVLEVNGTD